MALRGFRGRLVGDPFDGPRRPQHAADAAYADLRERNMEPAGIAPIAPAKWHGDTFPVQAFGFNSQPARVNRPDVVGASRRNVPLAQSMTHRASRRGW